MRLHVQECGSGSRTAVLVHGLTDDQSTWHRVAPHLAAQGFHVLAPDLRGHGLSGRSESYRLADFAADLVESLPYGVDLLLGHSLGALAVALAADDLAPRRLLYVDPPWRLTLALDGEASPSCWSAEDHAVDVASLVRMDPAVAKWIPARVVHEVAGAIPAGLVAPTLVLEPDTLALTDSTVRARLVEDGYVFRGLPGVQHVMHRDDLGAFLAALDDWTRSPVEVI